MRDQDLKKLVVQAQEGDLDALEELLRGIHGPLFSWLYMLRIPTHDIEDVAQNVAIEMHRSLTEYHSDKPFLPWLHALARHVAKNYWRGRERREKHRTAFERLAEQRMEACPPGADDGSRVERLRECMKRLQPKHREIVSMRYADGLDSERIGEAAGLSATAVRQLLSRVRNALRGCVEAAS